MEINRRCAIFSWPSLLAYWGSKVNTQGLLQLAKLVTKDFCALQLSQVALCENCMLMWGLHVASLWKPSAITIKQWWNERATPGNLSSCHFSIEASYSYLLILLLTEQEIVSMYLDQNIYRTPVLKIRMAAMSSWSNSAFLYMSQQSLKRHKAFYHPVTFLFFTPFEPSPLPMGPLCIETFSDLLKGILSIS